MGAYGEGEVGEHGDDVEVTRVCVHMERRGLERC